MVSYPDSTSAERSLPIRRPSSVASHSSRASTVRRHRTHRSLAGGSTLQPQNEFPVFTHTGDVEIVLNNGRREQRYLLHRLILAQCSGFFEAETAAGAGDEQSAPSHSTSTSTSTSTALARMPSGARQEKRRWRFELDWGGGHHHHHHHQGTSNSNSTSSENDYDYPMLVQRKAPQHHQHRHHPSTAASSSRTSSDAPPPALPPPAHNKPTAPSSGFFRSMASFSTLHVPAASASAAGGRPDTDPDDDTFRDYDNLFRIFYNYPPALDTVNIANAYVECKSLLALADTYDALEVIGPRVDHHLLRFQGRLWKQIAKYPPSYLKLGYMARSKAIFAEAMVHVVGQWPVGLAQLRGQISEPVLELIEDKVDELDELKSKIEIKLFRLSLTTSRGERVSPSSNYLDWLAVSLFRQWLAENTTPPPVPILKSSTHRPSLDRSATPMPSPQLQQQQSATFNTGKIFRLLGSPSPNAYLSHDECKRFLRLSPDLYSRDNLRRFERRVEEVKIKAKDLVKPLMRNFLELDLREGGLPYLTCTRVEVREFPWDE